MTNTQNEAKKRKDMEELLTYAQMGILHVDADGRIREISSVVLENTELRAEHMGLSIHHVNFMEEYPDFLQDIKAAGEQNRKLEREILRQGKTWLVKICPQTEGDLASGVLVALVEVLHARFHVRELNRQMDPLTGLYARQAVTTKIRERLWETIGGQNNWLILVDVDDFGTINATQGHLVGDAVLCMVADELRNSFLNGVLGRIGGDEFVLFLEDMDRTLLEQKLERLKEKLHEICRSTMRDTVLSCSIGVVSASGSEREWDRLLQWGNYAVFMVKRKGKNGYFIVEPQPDAQVPINDEQINSNYVNANEAVIRNEDELTMFTLELLDSVTDIESGLKMVSDRICSFFDIDDVAFVSYENDAHEKKYHWSRRRKMQSYQEALPEAQKEWDYIWHGLDENGVFILRKEEISHMPGEHVGALLFVNPEKGSARTCIIFVDREDDRDWTKEKDSLCRLADILFNHLKQLYDSERARSEIEFQINYDTLTRLPQYHKFVRMVNQFRKERGGSQYCFVYSDFTNFQYLNELYGYTEGDKVLAAFADTVSKHPSCIELCRVNSDYFVGFFDTKTGGIEAIQQEYLRITKEFCEQVNRSYAQINMVMISGISGLEDEDEPTSSAIDKANTARKYGKDLVITSVVLYSKEIRERNEIEKSITASMAAALENGEFEAWLQPKVSLTSGRIVGAEALVRWRRADGSMIYPDQFIPLFEKNGFITQIDFTVLDQVLDYLRNAMDVGEQVVPVSVNFSRRHNDDAEFVEEIMRRMQQKDIPSNLLEAEITESIFMLDLSALSGNLRKLKVYGISISIDDFGSGYSSLNVLANVDADIIKMDKKFLDSTADNPRASLFIKSLVNMMKKMGYKVIAEGVETKAQVELLEEAGCDMVQGFYYARPMPLADFREFLRQFNKSA